MVSSDCGLFFFSPDFLLWILRPLYCRLTGRKKKNKKKILALRCKSALGTLSSKHEGAAVLMSGYDEKGRKQYLQKNMLKKDALNTSDITGFSAKKRQTVNFGLLWSIQDNIGKQLTSE